MRPRPDNPPIIPFGLSLSKPYRARHIMRRRDPPTCQSVTLQINTRLIDMARVIGADSSELTNELVGAKIEREYWKRWNTDNAEAITHYNARIEREGLFSDRYRTFMRPDQQP
jgi:antitoxin CcdA